MLPAWSSPRGVSIVVVLLIILRADILERCRQLEILYAEWNMQRQSEYDGVRLVFVTPESAVREDFMRFLSRKKAVQHLDRIYINECYIILNN